MIRSLNDAILGLSTLIIGLYVTFSERVVEKVTGITQGGPLARADVYVRGIGGVLGILGLILIIKSLNFSKEEKEPLGIIFTKEVVLTMIALVIYVLILPIVGFLISSILMVAFITYIYRLKEDEGMVVSKKRIGATSIIYAIVLVLILNWTFTYLLKVTLP